MPKRLRSNSQPSDKQAKAGKLLRRAIDKSEAKEPPTVGKPVIEEPTTDDGDTSQRRAQRGIQRD